MDRLLHILLCAQQVVGYLSLVSAALHSYDFNMLIDIFFVVARKQAFSPCRGKENDKRTFSPPEACSHRVQ